MIIDILKSIKDVKIANETCQDNCILIDNKTKAEICYINHTKHSFELVDKFKYPDIYRILTWLNYKDKTTIPFSKSNCTGLECENCSGCALNSITELYNSRKVLKEYLPQSIIENYTFIGTLDIDNELLSPSPFKKYISVRDNKFILWENKCEKDSFNWHERILEKSTENLLNFLYIEQLIPEILKIPSHITKLYGVYNNKAVLWTLDTVYDRELWTFSRL